MLEMLSERIARGVLPSSDFRGGGKGGTLTETTGTGFTTCCSDGGTEIVTEGAFD